MAVRRNTNNRLTLFRKCYVCGKSIITTAASPYMRQMENVNGKKQAIVYFCSETCKNSTYKHKFDGLAWKRREEKEQCRDNKERNKRYYETHKAEIMAKKKEKYANMTAEERDALNSYRRAKHRVYRDEDNERQRNYRQRVKERNQSEQNI